MYGRAGRAGLYCCFWLGCTAGLSGVAGPPYSDEGQKKGIVINTKAKKPRQTKKRPGNCIMMTDPSKNRAQIAHQLASRIKDTGPGHGSVAALPIGLFCSRPVATARRR